MANIDLIDLRFEIECDISGSDAYKDITDRIMDVEKLRECPESAPYENEFSEFTFEVNNFDDWYTNVFENYFYSDPKISGSDYTYLHIYLNDVVMWCGYLDEPPYVDLGKRSVKFVFSHIYNRIHSKIIGVQAVPVLVHVLLTNSFNAAPKVMTDHVSLPTFWSPIDYFDPYEEKNPGSGSGFTGSGGLILDQVYYNDVFLHNSYFSANSQNEIETNILLKDFLFAFRMNPVFIRGELRIQEKLGREWLARTIDIDDILSYQPITDNWRYSLINTYTNNLDESDTLQHNYASYLPVSGQDIKGEWDIVHESMAWWYYYDNDLAALNSCNDYSDPDKPWMLLNAIYFALEYLGGQNNGLKIEVDGLDYYAGEVYILPDSIKEYNYYICRQTIKDIENRATELMLFPRRNIRSTF